MLVEDFDSVLKTFVHPEFVYDVQGLKITLMGVCTFVYLDGSTIDRPWRMCVGKDDLGRFQLSSYLSEEDIDYIFRQV